MSNNDEHNRGGFLTLIFSVVFCLVFFVYISFIHPGVDLKEVSEEAMNPEAAAPAVDLAKIEKPWIENADLVAHGQKVYKTNCAICHGDGGLGNGAAGAALVPPPRNLVEGKWKVGGSSVALYKTLQQGIAGGSMASFKHLPVVDRWAMVQFIRSITQNKVEDNASELEAFASSAD